MLNPPLISFHKGHGTHGEEHVHEGIQTLDSGFISIGHTQDEPDEETSDILIIKTDVSGNESWRKKIGNLGEWDVGIAIAESHDSFYAVGGKSQAGTQKPVIIKLTKDGKILWEKIFNSPEAGMLRGIDINNKGDIIVTGFHGGAEEGFVFLSEDTTGFAALINPSGKTIWENDYKQIPQGTKILSTANNGYAILSTVWNEEDTTPGDNAAILKISDQGEEQWINYYGGGNNQAFDFEFIPDTGYVIAGHTNSIEAVNWDGIMTKVDLDGNIIWRTVVGQPRGYDPKFIHDEFYGIVIDEDGSYVMAGGTGDETDAYEEGGHPSGSSGEWKAYLVKINPDGETVWEAVYGDSDQGHNAAEFLDTTNDGGYILFNDSDTVSISNKKPNNFGLMKLLTASDIVDPITTGEPTSTAPLEISAPKKYKKKFADIITDFNPAVDTLEIDVDSFDINRDGQIIFGVGRNKKQVKKLAKKDFDFLYDQKKGRLYFNENGSDKGFGEGGIIAILKGAPEVTNINLSFI